MKLGTIARPRRDSAAPAPVSLRALDAPRKDGAIEAAVFLLLVVAPLIMTPFSSSPSFDAKMVVLAPAALILAARRDIVRTSLAIPVAIWLAAVTAASIFGVDRWQSLMGREDQGAGLLLAVACGIFLLAGARLPEHLRDRIPAWLTAAGVAAALVGIAARLVPGWYHAATGRPLGGQGGGLPPLGHAVFLGAFLAAAIAAAVSVGRRRPVAAAIAIGIMGAAIVLTGKRGPVAFALIALGIALVRTRLPLRRAAALAGTLVVVIGALTVVDVVASAGTAAPLSAARRYDEVLSGSAAQRPAVWSAAFRAWKEHPLTGWGPGNTAAATLSAATESEARTMERIWQDAHNLAVASLVRTGLLGFLSLSLVMLVALRRLRRGTRSAGWALGAVIALGLHQAIQPINLVVTPLFFFLLGVAGRDDPAGESKASGEPDAATAAVAARAFRRVAIAVMIAAIPLSLLRLGASTMEANGRRYFSAGHQALYASLRLEPSRLSSASYLAVQLAIDGKGDPAGEAAARSFVAGLVDDHPWDPSIRLVAADVEIMLGDPARAARWLDRQLERFPNDALGLAFRSFAATRMGDEEAARVYAERAERINPSGAATWLPGSSAG